MDFEKKYHLTQFPNTYILARWTRGYKQIELFYQDKLIYTHEGTKNLKTGVKVNTSELGEIELKLSKEPILLNIVVEGYHCINNVSHPAKELKGASIYFWIIAVFAFVATLIEGFSIGVNSLKTIITTINLLVVAAYIIAAVFTSKSRPWAFYLGFSTYSFFTLLSVLILLKGNLIMFIGFGIRLVFLYFLITNIKHAVATTKHNRVRANRQEDVGLIDSEL